MPPSRDPSPAADPATVAVRVRPGASRTRVGGSYGEGEGARLVVAVTARAVDGAATSAVLRAVAEALGVRPHQVTLLRGATSRDKVLAVATPPADLARRIATLRDGSSPG
jgi:uncharacterized protein YggU (UPF0235/DUF167 family)